MGTATVKESGLWMWAGHPYEPLWGPVWVDMEKIMEAAEMNEAPYSHITHHGRRIVEVLQDADERGGPLICRRRMVGAEIGVLRGKNSATLLARCPNLRLYMIDHWSFFGEWRDPADPKTGPECYEEALAETSFAEDRRRIIGASSPRAVKLIEELLDFVFLDGDHRYEAVMADLKAWWPKVRPGGILFGHDIRNPNDWSADWGVERALEDFLHGLARRGVRPVVEIFGPPEMVFAIHKPEE